MGRILGSYEPHHRAGKPPRASTRRCTSDFQRWRIERFGSFGITGDLRSSTIDKATYFKDTRLRMPRMHDSRNSKGGRVTIHLQHPRSSQPSFILIYVILLSLILMLYTPTLLKIMSEIVSRVCNKNLCVLYYTYLPEFFSRLKKTNTRRLIYQI